MEKKTVKRILYGVAGIVFLILAGQEVAQAGISTDSVLPGGMGALFSYMAISGAG